MGSRDVLPAKLLPFALYLASIIQTASSPSPVLTAYYSVKFYHDLYGCFSPTESSLVVNVLEAAKRKLAKSISKKEPVTIALLQSVYSRLFVDSNIYNERIICAMFIAFAGFLRSSELLQIRLCDVKFESTYVKIFLEHSKINQYRDGAWIVISRTGTSLCPVNNLELYVKWSNFRDTDFLFCNLSATSCGEAALKPHVGNIDDYCLHSLRAHPQQQIMVLRIDYSSGTDAGLVIQQKMVT